MHSHNPMLTLLCCPRQGMFSSQHGAALQSTWSILCSICSKQDPGNSSGVCVWSDNTKCYRFLLPALGILAYQLAYQRCHLRHLMAKLQSSCGVTGAQSYPFFFFFTKNNKWIFTEVKKGKGKLQCRAIPIFTDFSFHSLPSHHSVLFLYLPLPFWFFL